MQILTNDWLTNDPIDFEYKKYMLLAYDQYHTKIYEEKKIYPSFTDIVDKIKIVNDFLQNVKAIEESKLEIKSVDWLSQKIHYASHIEDKSLKEVKSIASYSKEVLVDLYGRYRNLLDDVDNSITISGCRVEIFNLYDGYIIMHGFGKERILEYEVYRKLYPEPHYILKTCKANMKEYYNKRYTKNIFDVIFKESFPLKHSILPVYRRKFLESLFGYY